MFHNISQHKYLNMKQGFNTLLLTLYVHILYTGISKLVVFGPRGTSKKLKGTMKHTKVAPNERIVYVLAHWFSLKCFNRIYLHDFHTHYPCEVRLENAKM